MPIIKTLKQHKILLDTHVWLWLLTGDNTLSAVFRKNCERLFKLEHIFVSPISIWEIGMLVEKKRVELDRDVQEWVDHALEGINLVPITPHIAIQSTRLPGNIHGDSADRFLVASASIENAVLITCDHKLLQYGKDKFLSVYDPS